MSEKTIISISNESDEEISKILESVIFDENFPGYYRNECVNQLLSAHIDSEYYDSNSDNSHLILVIIVECSNSIRDIEVDTTGWYWYDIMNQQKLIDIFTGKEL